MIIELYNVIYNVQCETDGIPILQIPAAVLPAHEPDTVENHSSSDRFRTRGCIQKFPDWPLWERTANGTALCHWVQLYRYFV